MVRLGQPLALLATLSGLYGLAGCATTVDAPAAPPGLQGQPLELLPFINASGRAHAAQRAEAIATTLLEDRGFRQLTIYQIETSADELPLVEDDARYNRALEQARARGSKWGLTGTVVEWDYRRGLDGHPVVSVSLRLIDLKTGKVAWSSSGARSGWGRDSVGRVAQLLLRDLIDRLSAG